MPIYTFRNTKTNEESTHNMSYDDFKKYLEENPHLEQIFVAPNIADSVSLGITKPPVDFQRHVLSRVKAMPGANKKQIEKRWTIPKEV